MKDSSMLCDLIGNMPYRIALAGGWIDQPFVSSQNPAAPGSMVVVNVAPTHYFMERCGMGTSTRKVAQAMWGHSLPHRPAGELVRELYQAENAGKAEPSGSQDMAGLIFPGISRLDYDATIEGGAFPAHIESCNDPQTAAWLQGILYLLPVNQRPPTYNPLGIKNLEATWVARLGQSGKDCYQSILMRNIHALGESLNECMRCWEYLLPHTVRHPDIHIDLMGLLGYYQAHYAGAMYSGCGGGYLIVASDKPVPGGLQVQVRIQ